MKVFTKDFKFSHDGITPTQYKIGEQCNLTGFALECAERRSAVGEEKPKEKALPKVENKELPKGEDKEIKVKKSRKKKDK
jgi:hypothetical protein